jgi:hypothetical protein
MIGVYEEIPARIPGCAHNRDYQVVRNVCRLNENVFPGLQCSGMGYQNVGELIESVVGHEHIPRGEETGTRVFRVT